MIKKIGDFKTYWSRNTDANPITEVDRLRNEVQDEIALLERDILHKQLAAIDERHKLQAQIEKRECLVEWYNRDIPRSLKNEQ